MLAVVSHKSRRLAVVMNEMSFGQQNLKELICRASVGIMTTTTSDVSTVTPLTLSELSSHPSPRLRYLFQLLSKFLSTFTSATIVDGIADKFIPPKLRHNKETQAKWRAFIQRQIDSIKINALDEFAVICAEHDIPLWCEQLDRIERSQPALDDGNTLTNITQLTDSESFIRAAVMEVKRAEKERLLALSESLESERASLQQNVLQLRSQVDAAHTVIQRTVDAYHQMLQISQQTSLPAVNNDYL